MISVGTLFFGLSLVICVSGAVANHPYQVSVHLYTGTHICSGAIITPRHVLTVARCLTDTERKIRPGFVRYVLTEGIDFSKAKKENIFDILEIKIPHAKNPYGFYENDIAVLKVERDITFGENRMSISLPLKDTAVGTLGKASGWEMPLTKQFGKKDALLGDLRTTEETVIDGKECQSLLPSESIKPEHVCTHPKEESELCQWDLGAPFVDGKHIVGIMSFNHPSFEGDICVYTRIYKFLPWIQQTIKSL